MAEHEGADGLANDAEFASGAGPSSESAAAAVALALGKAGSGVRLAPEAADFLKRQSRLIDIQTEHLHEQRELVLSRLRWGRFSDRIKAALQLMTAAVGLAIAGAVAVMAWQAHEDHGVAIAAFSLPPDFSQRGLTGQVLASELLDRLSDLQARTVTARPASTYANDWGGDIKVEIPETGVSIGELNRYLREWLGSETRITGEIVRTPSGIAVTARAGDASGRRFEGSEADVDRLVGEAAEAIYAQTQPYRYAVYLRSHGHMDEALARFQWLAHHGSPEDQAWAYGGWSSALLARGDYEGIIRVVREGQARDLPLYDSSALNNLGVALNQLSRNEAMLVVSRQVLREVRRTGRGFDGLSRQAAERNMRVVIDAHFGSVRNGFGSDGQIHDLDVEGAQGGVDVQPLQARQFIVNHDVAAGLRLSSPTPAPGYGPGNLQLRAALELADWPGAVAAGEPELAAELADTHQRQVAVRTTAAILAVAYARVGRLAEARALVASTPADCDACVEARGVVAALGRDAAGADRWFAEAVRMAPSIPMPETSWAAVLLARGDVDGAIAKLKVAHGKGPQFPDALELWGEALMRRSDYAGAAAKFAEADKYAPRWGRDHLMWGQALMLSGRYRQARAQYVTANGLDLSKPDRAALNLLLARTASGPLHG